MRISRPRSKRHFSGLFLSHQGIVSMFFSGVGRKPSTQSRRLVRRKDSSWSLNRPSGANLLAHKQHRYFLYVPL